MLTNSDGGLLVISLAAIKAQQPELSSNFEKSFESSTAVADMPYRMVGYYRPGM
jgi:hypothetical protein